MIPISFVAGGSMAATPMIFGTINSLAQEATTSLRVVALVIAIGFVLVTAIATRGRMVPIILSGVTAGLLIWLVFNITSVETLVGDTLTAPAAGDSGLTADPVELRV